MRPRDLAHVLGDAAMCGVVSEWLAGVLVADHALAEELAKPWYELDEGVARRLLEECKAARAQP